MTLRFEGGALVLRRPTDNTVRFNSNEGLFNGTNYLNGAFGLPSYSATSTETGIASLVDTANDFAVSSVAAGSTHVFGFLRTVWSGGGGTAGGLDGIWRDASGSHIDSWLGLDNRATPTAADQATFFFYMGCMSIMTFYVSAGTLRFRERIVLRASTVRPGGPPLTVTRPALTLSYRLLTGYFL